MWIEFYAAKLVTAGAKVRVFSQLRKCNPVFSVFFLSFLSLFGVLVFLFS